MKIYLPYTWSPGGDEFDSAWATREEAEQRLAQIATSGHWRMPINNGSSWGVGILEYEVGSGAFYEFCDWQKDGFLPQPPDSL